MKLLPKILSQAGGVIKTKRLKNDVDGYEVTDGLGVRAGVSVTWNVV